MSVRVPRKLKKRLRAEGLYDAEVMRLRLTMMLLSELQLECGHNGEVTTIEYMDHGVMLYDGWVAAECKTCGYWAPRTFTSQRLTDRVAEICREQNSSRKS